MNIAEEIKSAREAAGLTQLQLAERLGMSRDGVARWEAGQRAPVLGDLERIAEALGLQVVEKIFRKKRKSIQNNA